MIVFVKCVTLPGCFKIVQCYALLYLVIYLFRLKPLLTQKPAPLLKCNTIFHAARLKVMVYSMLSSVIRSYFQLGENDLLETIKATDRPESLVSENNKVITNALNISLRGVGSNSPRPLSDYDTTK